MTESTPIPNGPFPSFTLDPPQHPPRMTREEAIARIKYNYRYPAEMPNDIWRTEYGAVQEWEPPYPSVREEGTPWIKHVWKVTATGEQLADGPRAGYRAHREDDYRGKRRYLAASFRTGAVWEVAGGAGLRRCRRGWIEEMQENIDEAG